jgi:hypothetical protein
MRSNVMRIMNNKPVNNSFKLEAVITPTGELAKFRSILEQFDTLEEDIADALTPQEIKMIQRVANQTWDGIGSDVLAATGENTMSKKDVIEIVLDADHMLGIGHMDRDLYYKFQALPYEEKMAIMDKAFTYSTYGY